MGRLQVREVGQVPLSPGVALQRDKVGQRADRHGHAVHLLDVGALSQQSERDAGDVLLGGIEDGVDVARTTPCRIRAIPPISTYLISAAFRSSRI